MVKYLKKFAAITAMAALMVSGAAVASFAADASDGDSTPVYQDGVYTTEVQTDRAGYSPSPEKELDLKYPNKDYPVEVAVIIKDGKIVDLAYTKDPNEFTVNTSSDFNYLLWAMDGHQVTETSYNYLAGPGKNYEKYQLDPKPPMNGVGMRDQIIAKNGTEGVDTVTAATLTSQAIIASVDKSLERAVKGEKDDPEPVLPQPDTSDSIIPADGFYAVLNTEDNVEEVGFDANKMDEGKTEESNRFFLNVNDGKITAQLPIEQRQSSYPYIFAGTEKEALAAGEAGWLKPTDFDYGHRTSKGEVAPGSLYQNVPIASLDKPLHFMMFAKGSGNWFNRLLTIKSAGLKQIPYGNYEPNEFKYEGGTGKVTLTCPQIHVTKDGVTADINFSSSKYTKAAVNGVEYEPADKTNGTTFTVPINLNAETVVSGTTVAMSSPQTIDYTCIISFNPNDLKIIKAKNPMTAKAVNKTYKVKNLKKKAISYKAVTVKNAQGKVTYTAKAANAKSKKALTFKNGKLTVKKKTKKGTYKMKVTVKDAGNEYFVPATKKITITVKVK